MSSQQYIGMYSDNDDKKLFKIRRDGIFYARKTLKIHQGCIALIMGLLTKRKENNFSCILEPFEFKISKTTSPKKIITLTFPFLQHKLLKIMCFSDFLLTEVLQTAFLTMLRGENEYFYSYENMLFDSSTSKLTFAPYSIIGIIPLYSKASFSRREFSQVYQLMSQGMFNQESPIQFSYKTKFRALGMLILHFIFQKRISLVLEGDLTSEQVPYERAKDLVKKLRERFEKLLHLPCAIRVIQDAAHRDKANYLIFLKRVFVQNCEEMRWKTVQDYLFPTLFAEDKEVCLEKLSPQMNSHQTQKENVRLQKLGIFDSEPDIYMAYKLQTTKLRLKDERSAIETHISSQLKRLIPKELYGKTNKAIKQYEMSKQSAQDNAEHLLQSLSASKQWNEFVKLLISQSIPMPSKKNGQIYDGS